MNSIDDDWEDESDIMDVESGVAWPWTSVHVGEDDRTLTVRFRGNFDAEQLVPTVRTEPGPEAVAVRLMLVVTPSSDDLGVALFGEGPDAAEHEVIATLDEPLAGRPLVDGWAPPPPPPEPYRSLTIGAAFEGVAEGRTLVLERIDFYDSYGGTSSGGAMSVDYRLRPGARAEDEPTHLMWDLEVEDDLGTEYEVPSGAYGEHPDQIDGDRTVVPAAPDAARQLTLIVFDGGSDGAFHEVGRTTVALD